MAVLRQKFTRATEAGNPCISRPLGNSPASPPALSRRGGKARAQILGSCHRVNEERARAPKRKFFHKE